MLFTDKTPFNSLNKQCPSTKQVGRNTERLPSTASYPVYSHKLTPDERHCSYHILLNCQNFKNAAKILQQLFFVDSSRTKCT